MVSRRSIKDTSSALSLRVVPRILIDLCIAMFSFRLSAALDTFRRPTVFSLVASVASRILFKVEQEVERRQVAAVTGLGKGATDQTNGAVGPANPTSSQEIVPGTRADIPHHLHMSESPNTFPTSPLTPRTRTR
ncbi:hypothetical protein PAXRUDRAFT_831141 [Paxillus rubicundulus Ve08.2h10]|uniref:Uncharacterized protein n=1 Tax=Paxillus rubicundulus Ve08.2h10 TaxID=930991 RepID=A0A0D0D3M6_9AGAM|nr:hypothetical protein PAXRUDRAFT_831141 [Paxillus rubicundulus Ve08.2h10]